jgi:hypothetical protein
MFSRTRAHILHAVLLQTGRAYEQNSQWISQMLRLNRLDR